jgi:hypothetical protein
MPHVASHPHDCQPRQVRVPGLTDALPDRVAAQVLRGERLVDDDRTGTACSVGVGELAPLQQRNPHRGEVAGCNEPVLRDRRLGGVSGLVRANESAHAVAARERQRVRATRGNHTGDASNPLQHGLMEGGHGLR